MSQPVTYYDSLKVARDAPPEVVRAAYRALAQKYHPDRNPGDAASASIMSTVNVAYRVLSDPGLREQYDNMLRSSELAANLRNADEEAGAPRSARQRKHFVPPAHSPESPNAEHAPDSRSVDLDEIWARFVGKGNEHAPSDREPPHPIHEDRLVSGSVDLDKVWDSFLGFLNPWGSKK